MLEPVGVHAGLPHSDASVVAGHDGKPFARSLVKLVRLGGMNRAGSENALIEVRGLQRQFRFFQSVADSAEPFDPGVDRPSDDRVHFLTGAGFAGSEVGVGVDKSTHTLGRNGRGTRLLLRHSFQPILGGMNFMDLDDATRAQIDRDLAEAAVAGINGSIADIVASFEETLGEYFALEPDLRRAYPRGETARMFGTALGDAFIREHGFTWHILSDDYGTDLVVTSPDRDMYTAPLVVVDTRFEDEETGKLTAFIEQFMGD